MEVEKLTCSVPEAAKILGVSKTTCYQLARQAGFPAFSVGGRWLVSRAGLAAWVEAKAKGGEVNAQ